MPGSRATVITVENLTKSFWSTAGRVVALDGVSIDVTPGSVFGIVGPSGSGKSTLGKLASLQERPDTGVVRFDGVNTATLDQRGLRAARRSISVVAGHAAQGPDGLTPHRTTAGNIALPLEQAGVDGPARKRKVGQLLDLVGLTERAAASPGELTPAQRQRALVARALVGEPAVLLADEPTKGLDPDAQVGVLAALDRARAELGVTVLLATEDTAIVRRVADEAALLDDGRLVASGGLLDIASDLGNPLAQALLPVIETAPGTGALYDRVADVVLIGFAAVGALLPEASSRFGTELSVLGGGLVRFGDTPVARFRIGVAGGRADAALTWIAERGGVVDHPKSGPQGVAA
jgi:D-methionine transport system ATP-binding protein